MTDTGPAPSEDPRPLLRVVRGDPTPEELAALLAVLTLRATPTVDESSAPPSFYADPSTGHRTPLRVAPGAWMSSGWIPGTRTRAAW